MTSGVAPATLSLAKLVLRLLLKVAAPAAGAAPDGRTAAVRAQPVAELARVAEIPEREVGLLAPLERAAGCAEAKCARGIPRATPEPPLRREPGKRAPPAEVGRHRG